MLFFLSLYFLSPKPQNPTYKLFSQHSSLVFESSVEVRRLASYAAVVMTRLVERSLELLTHISPSRSGTVVSTLLLLNLFDLLNGFDQLLLILDGRLLSVLHLSLLGFSCRSSLHHSVTNTLNHCCSLSLISFGFRVTCCGGDLFFT